MEYNYNDILEFHAKDLTYFKFKPKLGYYFNGNYYAKLRSARMARAKSKGNHSKYEWHKMVIFFNNQCVKCGIIFKYNHEINKDHIIPLFMGGSNSIKNVQPLCFDCNTRKKDTIDYRLSVCSHTDLNNFYKSLL